MSLPSGYKRLEYIQSSGKQYINTGFKPNNNTRVVMDAELARGTGNHALFGARLSFDADNYALAWIGSYFRSDYNTVYTQKWEVSQTTRRIYDKNKETSTIDGVSQSYINEAFQVPVNLALLANNQDGSIMWFASAKLYSCQIYDNGTLIRNYIPCINASGEVGLYDLVGKQFYGNARTGTFTAGPEVQQTPSTPTGFAASVLTDTTVKLSWTASDEVTGYKLYRNGILIATLTDTSYTDTIQPFTSYIYTLTAYNDNGESDPATISVQIIIPPESPSNFRVSYASMETISLAWDAVTGAESYQLLRDGLIIYTGEYPSYTDSGLTSETAYTYTLSAVNSAGISAATTLEVTTTQLILVTDRTEADVAAQNAKGTYNASDLNRVGAAMNYVAKRLRSAGYAANISAKIDWTDRDIPTNEQMQSYISDLSELRGQLSQAPTTPDCPPDMVNLTWQEANDIERILQDTDAILTNIIAGMFYSGELYCGEA